MKKALVALPDQIWDIIDSELKGKMGEGHSDIVRAIVLSYLSEKGYWTKAEKLRAKKESSRTAKKDEDSDVLDTMITSLAKLLEEKGYINQEEWEQKIKKNLKS